MEIPPSNISPPSVVLDPKAQRSRPFSDLSNKLSAQSNPQSDIYLRNLSDHPSLLVYS
jgi:hypothetical protein